MGFRCINPDCGFEYYGLDCSSSDGDNHEKWVEMLIDKINEQGITK